MKVKVEYCDRKSKFEIIDSCCIRKNCKHHFLAVSPTAQLVILLKVNGMYVMSDLNNL
jgi:hypothetical protein